jgi:hypothetical protein
MTAKILLVLDGVNSGSTKCGMCAEHTSGSRAGATCKKFGCRINPQIPFHPGMFLRCPACLDAEDALDDFRAKAVEDTEEAMCDFCDQWE